MVVYLISMGEYFKFSQHLECYNRTFLYGSDRARGIWFGYGNGSFGKLTVDETIKMADGVPSLCSSTG